MLIACAIGAAAQTAQPAATPGKPIQLLQIVERSDKTTKTKSHVKPVAKSHHKHVAAKTHHAPVPANEPAIATVAAVPAIDPPTDPTLAFAEPMPNVVTVAGQSVQVAAPEDVNDIDRAADTLDKLARKNVAAADAAASLGPAVPASTATVVTSAPPDTSAGSVNASWLAEALAALGGAIAAASAAWFLIGSTPQRLYG
jgi:hypothetical protein